MCLSRRHDSHEPIHRTEGLCIEQTSDLLTASGRAWLSHSSRSVYDPYRDARILSELFSLGVNCIFQVPPRGVDQLSETALTG